jgi:hypothetical protein
VTIDATTSIPQVINELLVITDPTGYPMSPSAVYSLPRGAAFDVAADYPHGLVKLAECSTPQAARALTLALADVLGCEYDVTQTPEPDHTQQGADG